MSISNLHPHLRSVLVFFHEAGGCGWLDMHKNVLCGPTRGPVPAAKMSDWLDLMVKGLIAGESDQVLLTEEGRAEAERIIAGRTRAGA